MVLLTFQNLTLDPVFSALVNDFYDFVSASLLGRESIQQFSIEIYSFSAGHLPKSTELRQYYCVAL